MNIFLLELELRVNVHILKDLLDLKLNDRKAGIMVDLLTNSARKIIKNTTGASTAYVDAWLGIGEPVWLLPWRAEKGKMEVLFDCVIEIEVNK
jgi:hypothetical protein